MSWTKTGERCDAKIRTAIRSMFNAPSNVPIECGDVACPMMVGSCKCSTRMIVIPKNFKVN